MTQPDVPASSLAGSFPVEAPGLPRGRTRMPAGKVETAQRARIQRAAIAAFAEIGFAATTVADIVARARVSRAAFYRLFDGKQACFLAAILAGRDAMMPRIVAAALTTPSPRFAGAVRATVREYLRVCAGEPEFTRAWTLELPTAGAEALRQRNDYFDALAGVLRTADALHHPDREPLPDPMYAALIGGCHELFHRYVSDGRTAALPELEDDIVAFLLRCLEPSIHDPGRTLS